MMLIKNKSLKLGFFLALREIKRSNFWTNALIIFVMSLTFFNMNLIGGVLIGIANGVASSYRGYYSGNILITPTTHNKYIKDTSDIDNIVKTMPGYLGSSVRYTAPVKIEYGYKDKLRVSDLPESAEGVLTGIVPQDEDIVTKLSDSVVAGEYLSLSDADEILVGSSLIKKYSSLRGAANNVGSRILEHADVGSRVRIAVNGVTREVTIKGIISTGGTNIDNRIFMLGSTVRSILNDDSLNANEIAIALTPETNESEAKKYIVNILNYNEDVLIQTSSEALPGGIIDIIKTFSILGNIVGGIALIVGAITIFIVIFVNAVTRRKYIGILKGIGITPRAIEFSYIFQALFYAVSGIVVASILVRYYIVPYFDIHPINYPIAKGSLAISGSELFWRGVVLSLTSIFSGFVPAWLVTRQNTLDAILGR